MTSSSCSKVASSSPVGADVADGKWFFVPGTVSLVKATEPSKNDLLKSETASKSDVKVDAGLLSMDRLSVRKAVRSMLMSKGRLGHSSSKLRGHGVFRGNVIAAIGIATNASGVYNVILGDALFAAAPDFTNFSNLFDISRVTGIRILYRPYNGGGMPLLTASTFGTHVSMAACYDPEALTAASWTTLSSTRDWCDEKNNIIKHTGESVSHTFACPSGKKVVGDNGSATTPAMGQWVDNLAYTSGRVDGGVLLALYPHVLNVSTNIGSLFVVFETEWAYRL